MALPPLGLPPIEKGRPVAGRPFCFVEKCVIIGQNAYRLWVLCVLPMREMRDVSTRSERQVEGVSRFGYEREAERRSPPKVVLEASSSCIGEVTVLRDD